MAAITTTLLPGLAKEQRGKARPTASLREVPWRWVLPLLTAGTLLVDGYHPFSEDGGLYVAGIEYRLDPTLFPHYTAFVTAHLRYSLFAPAMAALVRLTHLSLEAALFLGYIFSLWLLLFAGLQILRRCTRNPLAQLCGVALLGAWSTLPVAGTSLLLTDPYLTARSFTTPLSLLAIAFALDDWQLPRSSRMRLSSLHLCAISLVLAALLHPLMAMFAMAIVILLRLVRNPRALQSCCAVAAITVLAAAVLHTLAPQDAQPVVAASLSRYYWFLSQWHWYEVCGLFGPVAILELLQRRQPNDAIRYLCRSCLAAGGTAILLALIFAHAHDSTYLIARLQPLRIFLPLYAVMTLLLGATVTQYLANRAPRPMLLLPALAILISSVSLFFAQRATYPSSPAIELPNHMPANPWLQAFVWIRNNTPRDDLFALDADYITTPGEDAQSFHAVAQRSAVPDFSKDGGEASITPSLAGSWQHALQAQFAVQSGISLIGRNRLSQQNDAERDAHLLPLGVTWIVLLSDARTAHPCAYNNGTVKVCSLASQAQ